MLSTLIMSTVTCLSLCADPASAPNPEPAAAQSADSIPKKEGTEKLSKLLDDKEYAKALRYCDDFGAKNQDFAGQTVPIRLALMVRLSNDPEQILAFAKEQTKEETKNPDDRLVILRAILEPMDILNPNDATRPESHPTLDPALIKFAVSQADGIVGAIKAEKTKASPPKAEAGKEKDPADKSAAATAESDDDLGGSSPESGFDSADMRVLLAHAYELAGDKEKATAQLDEGIKALNGMIHAARDELKDLREMKKALSGEAATDKTTDASEKPAIHKKKKTEP